MDMTLKEYCDWLQDFTEAGDVIGSEGLQKWITDYAINYHQEQLRICAVGCCKEQLKCDACKGTGTVEGEHYDDLQSCNNCLGKGTF